MNKKHQCDFIRILVAVLCFRLHTITATTTCQVKLEEYSDCSASFWPSVPLCGTCNSTHYVIPWVAPRHTYFYQPDVIVETEDDTRENPPCATADKPLSIQINKESSVEWIQFYVFTRSGCAVRDGKTTSDGYPATCVYQVDLTECVRTPTTTNAEPLTAGAPTDTATGRDLLDPEVKRHPPHPENKGHPPHPENKGHPPHPENKGHLPHLEDKGHITMSQLESLALVAGIVIFVILLIIAIVLCVRKCCCAKAQVYVVKTPGLAAREQLRAELRAKPGVPIIELLLDNLYSTPTFNSSSSIVVVPVSNPHYEFRLQRPSKRDLLKIVTKLIINKISGTENTWPDYLCLLECRGLKNIIADIRSGPMQIYTQQVSMESTDDTEADLVTDGDTLLREIKSLSKHNPVIWRGQGDTPNLKEAIDRARDDDKDSLDGEEEWRLNINEHLHSMI